MSAAHHYPTDLPEAPWHFLPCVLPARAWHPGGRGRPPSCDMRRIGNGMVSRKKTGCQWRMMPQACGHWRTIYGSFKRWRRAGVWAGVLETLRPWERRCLGRKPAPSAGSSDSQSIKTATQSEHIGGEGNKKSKGRKRHLLFDTLGVSMAGAVPDASTEDCLGVVALLRQYFAAGGKRLRKIWVDGAYPAERKPLDSVVENDTKGMRPLVQIPIHGDLS